MNFGQLQSEVRTRLNESSTAFYTDQDIQDALNEGLAELADGTEYYERQAILPLTADRAYYDLSTILPDTVLTVKRIFNPVTNRWLTPSGPRDLDDSIGLWETTQGPPESYFLRGNWWLGMFPKEDTDTLGLRVYSSAIPPSMSDSTDVPGFPKEFHFGLVDYALFDCFAQQRETKKALFYWQSYLGYEARLSAWVSQRQRLDRREVLS